MEKQSEKLAESLETTRKEAETLQGPEDHPDACAVSFEKHFTVCKHSSSRSMICSEDLTRKETLGVSGDETS